MLIPERTVCQPYPELQLRHRRSRVQRDSQREYGQEHAPWWTKRLGLQKLHDCCVYFYFCHLHAHRSGGGTRFSWRSHFLHHLHGGPLYVAYQDDRSIYAAEDAPHADATCKASPAQSEIVKANLADILEPRRFPKQRDRDSTKSYHVPAVLRPSCRH